MKKKFYHCGIGVNATLVAMYTAMQIEVCRVNHWTHILWTPNYTISIIWGIDSPASITVASTNQ